jgi:protein phosphatase
MNTINLPEFSLVLLIGTSSAGKSTFARKHFLATQIVSSDYCRALVDDDENNQKASADAFELLHFLIEKRLKRKKLTVVDATNLQLHTRRMLLRLAKDYHCQTFAIVFDLPKHILLKRHHQRTDRHFEDVVIETHYQDLILTLPKLRKEHYREIITFNTEEAINKVVVNLEKLPNNKRNYTNPFDIIGDIHGCADELTDLLTDLGYQIEKDDKYKYQFKITPPDDRMAFFVGDLTDRGPDSPRVLKMVMSMVKAGTAFCVSGNHDDKLARYLKENKVNTKHGLDTTIEQLDRETGDFKDEVLNFLTKLDSHYIADEGRLVVAHAGINEFLQGRESGAVRSFCLYGDTTGKKYPSGMPVRLNWADKYRGDALVVYGHVAVSKAEFVNNTIDIDTACVFGGQLTALRYPEGELVQIPARELYYKKRTPITRLYRNLSIQHIEGVEWKRSALITERKIPTHLRRNILVKTSQLTKAFDKINTSELSPNWLFYIPATTLRIPVTEVENGFLEHPNSIFSFYKRKGIQRLVCQEKHSGTRALIIVCKNAAAAEERFKVEDGSNGVCYTRNGFPFFDDKNVEEGFITGLQKALTDANIWEELDTDWVLLEGQITPDFIKPMFFKTIEKYEENLANYFKNIQTTSDFQFAPFHFLASERQTHTNKTHEWHLKMLQKIIVQNPILLKNTDYKTVNLEDKTTCEAVVNWWLDMDSKGKEGIVIKPSQFISYNEGKLAIPTMNCFGREFLRLVYGADYTQPDRLKRLQSRSVVIKNSPMQEFPLAMEALERFVGYAPMKEVQECVLGVLAFREGK